MNIVGLDAAISEIKQACDDTGAEPRRSPFFLVVGAGISAESVPLAGEIIDRCKEQARKFHRDPGAEPRQVLDQYSVWFSLAYPHPRERQAYLRSLIETKPISLANLRLAHLLSGGKLTNLVVTSNFDDYMAKALRLFGKLPVVCDHPSTVARIDMERDDLQIVHVHGSYLFYDCANLRGEIRGRARADRTSSLTVLGFLDAILWNRSPLVIGYSGWEGDVIMSALRRRLCGGHPLGQNLYWFCYQRDTAQSLPKWLTENSQVRLVVPPDREETGLPGTGQRKPETIPLLTAQAVFEGFIGSFGLEEPRLFNDPVNHFADLLETSLLPEEESSLERDPYGIRGVVQLMREASKRSPAVHSAVHADVRSHLEAVRKAIRQPRYREAILACAYFIPDRLDSLTPEQRKEVLDDAALAGDSLLPKLTDIEADLVEPLARVLSVDIRLEERLAGLPSDMVVVFPARPGQMAYDALSGAKHRGAFSYQLEQAIQRAITSQKHKPKPTIQELVIEASIGLLKGSQVQCPVVVGCGSEASLFIERDGGAVRGRLRALLIGINRYEMGSNLAGCVNDVNAFWKLLRENKAAFGNPVVARLTDEAATASGIRKALDKLALSGRPDDVMFFHFSGHLTQAAEQGPDQRGHREILVAHNFSDKGTGHLLLQEVVEKLRPAKARCKIVILD